MVNEASVMVNVAPGSARIDQLSVNPPTNADVINTLTIFSKKQ